MMKGEMEQIMKSLIFLAFSLQLSSAAKHSLRYFYTAVTPGINFPEFTTVGMVDDEQFEYYDSDLGRDGPKGDWIHKVVVDNPDYWNSQTQTSLGTQESFKANIAIAMQRFNHTKGVHTVQYMYGCEMDDDGTKRGYEQFGYDGEDFISLDLKTGAYVAPVFQAVSTKQKWDRGSEVSFTKTYLEKECIEWLQKYVGYGRSVLERKVHPKVDLFSSDSSSPVVCHATGFFPKAVMISWQKNGEDLNEDVDLRETVPNQDGTFQKRSILTLSPEELKNNQYTCVVQHSSLEKELVLKVSDRRILSGGVLVGVIVGVLVAAALIAIIAIGAVVWKKKKGFKRVPGNPPSDSSSNNS